MEDKISACLEKINKFARTKLTEKDVYIFDIILCDNEIDRDNEMFSVSSLKALAQMFIGKTGIFDHNPKGENQTARIFDTKVIADSSKKTATGDNYTYLKAKAYMIKTTKNDDLIKEIDGGIKKEVSVSCSVAKKICSICHEDTNKKACPHKKGRIYGNKKCYIILDEPTDAYEWSFVAVPAQKNAGVTKHYNATGLSDGTVTINRCDYEMLVNKADKNNNIASEVCDSLKREIIKMSFLIAPQTSVATLKKLAEGMSITELYNFKENLSKELSLKKTSKPILNVIREDNENFKVNKNKR